MKGMKSNSPRTSNRPSNKSPEPTAVGPFSSAFAVRAGWSRVPELWTLGIIHVLSNIEHQLLLGHYWFHYLPVVPSGQPIVLGHPVITSSSSREFPSAPCIPV